MSPQLRAARLAGVVNGEMSDWCSLSITGTPQHLASAPKDRQFFTTDVQGSVAADETVRVASKTLLVLSDEFERFGDY